MKIIICTLLGLISHVALASVRGSYELENVTSISDGAFGSVRLNFNLNCNQRFIQTLTKSVDRTELQVGILTVFENVDCGDPARETFTRLTPGNRQIVPVSSFDAVWRCTGTCFTPGGPDMPPYNRPVEAYGTSEEQATGFLGCSPPYLQRLSCVQLDI